ncbi:hypothetical protein G3N56_08460 [Desulfovibrio sulfodismutans]|uniref:Uncharacterized protein n=1 Tax=Desulfolutivibrio sulfodismutans TaxID=63561 RepID=A0A7K3NLY1_9BACT|nr:hypothetical protein [Desulfolutivibrio sulfodismutans]NDY56775.1 hypothetical protein [Desulfolutivibrio sulfodismutans]QLA13318.1 hypothetical protein GD606_14130 [Desulfolutivibrio sulfodismutans DSM 3696]
MDNTPDPRDAMRREAARAVRQAAMSGEDGHSPFSRTRFRVVPTDGTPPGKRDGDGREGEQ